VSPHRLSHCAPRGSRAAHARTHPPARPRPRADGFSLIVAMLMLAVIGLTAAAIMRNATSGDQVANNTRLQAQASQYAQLALKFCETQMALAPAARSVTLAPAASKAAWSVRTNWTQAGAASAHTLAAAEIGSAVQPRVAPQCLMEATAIPDVYTLTARGFSADFRADAVTGATRSGSVVWLQATIFAQGDGGAAGEGSANAGTDTGANARPATGALLVRQRQWQQLLTPPF
jgi:type II secretory pathway pseudopilin PulG